MNDLVFTITMPMSVIDCLEGMMSSRVSTLRHMQESDPAQHDRFQPIIETYETILAALRAEKPARVKEAARG